LVSAESQKTSCCDLSPAESFHLRVFSGVNCLSGYTALRSKAFEHIDEEVQRWLKKAYDMDAETRKSHPAAKLSSR
jgi:hypothetical protein